MIDAEIWTVIALFIASWAAFLTMTYKLGSMRTDIRYIKEKLEELSGIIFRSINSK